MKIRVIDGCVPYKKVDHVAGTESAIFELDDVNGKALVDAGVAVDVDAEIAAANKASKDEKAGGGK